MTDLRQIISWSAERHILWLMAAAGNGVRRREVLSETDYERWLNERAFPIMVRPEAHLIKRKNYRWLRWDSPDPTKTWINDGLPMPDLRSERSAQDLGQIAPFAIDLYWSSIDLAIPNWLPPEIATGKITRTMLGALDASRNAYDRKLKEYLGDIAGVYDSIRGALLVWIDTVDECRDLYRPVLERMHIDETDRTIDQARFVSMSAVERMWSRLANIGELFDLDRPRNMPSNEFKLRKRLSRWHENLDRILDGSPLDVNPAVLRSVHQACSWGIKELGDLGRQAIQWYVRRGLAHHVIDRSALGGAPGPRDSRAAKVKKRQMREPGASPSRQGPKVRHLDKRKAFIPAVVLESEYVEGQLRFKKDTGGRYVIGPKWIESKRAGNRPSARQIILEISRLDEKLCPSDAVGDPYQRLHGWYTDKMKRGGALSHYLTIAEPSNLENWFEMARQIADELEGVVPPEIATTLKRLNKA
jgi:hypothetical protein